MKFSKIERQVLNIIMAISNLMNDTDIDCIIEIISNKINKNMSISLSLKKDGKLSSTKFDIDVLSESDYVFYNYFLSMIIDNYVNHNEIFISDIKKDFRMIIGINSDDFFYMFKIGHIDGIKNIKVFLNSRSDIDDIVNIYNQKLLNVDSSIIVNKKNK